MRAGVAKVCITPPVGTWQGGYGARNRPCEDVHDDLFARALVLESAGAAGGEGQTTRAALVSVDIVGLTHELAAASRRRAEAMTGIPAANIALCASHTHGGPVTRSSTGLGGPQTDPEYLAVLEKYLAGAVAAAARRLAPAAIRLGRSQAGFNVNRRLRTPAGTVMRPNPEGPVDREVLAVRVDPLDEGQTTKDGADSSFVARLAPRAAGAPSATRLRWEPAGPPLAVLFRFTCHATAMGGQNYLITADYPGAAAAVIEQAYHGWTAAHFLQGCAGNIRPHLSSADGGFRSAGWTEVAALGRELGGAALAAAERAAPPEGGAAALGVAGKTVLLPYAPAPAAAELERLVATGRWPDGRLLDETERLWAARTLEAQRGPGLAPGVPAEVQVFRLGGVWLAVLSGEVFVEIGWRVRDAVAEAVGTAPANVLVAAYANGNVGYVPTAGAIPEGGYEVFAYRHMGRPCGYAPEAEDVLARTAAELAAQVAAGQERSQLHHHHPD